MTMPIADARERAEWWKRRRLRYNAGLVAAGVLAFCAYAAVFELKLRDQPDAEITLMTIGVQGVGYLVMMVIANICYFLGPLAERVIRPAEPLRFRKTTYLLGCGFSFALPFAVPVLVWLLN